MCWPTHHPNDITSITKENKWKHNHCCRIKFGGTDLANFNKQFNLYHMFPQMLHSRHCLVNDYSVSWIYELLLYIIGLLWPMVFCDRTILCQMQWVSSDLCSINEELLPSNMNMQWLMVFYQWRNCFYVQRPNIFYGTVIGWFLEKSLWMWLWGANPWAHSSDLPTPGDSTPTVLARRHWSGHQALGASCRTTADGGLPSSYRPEDLAWSSHQTQKKKKKKKSQNFMQIAWELPRVFCVPLLDLWGSPFWAIFLRMWPFFNPTIEVVTFCLHGWCTLDVFLLPAFTRLGHECQDFLSPCGGMVYTLVYTLIRKSLGEWSQNPC